MGVGRRALDEGRGARGEGRGERDEGRVVRGGCVGFDWVAFVRGVR